MKYLIVGLGNIGNEYEGTRHNIGFDVVDLLAKEMEGSFKPDTHVTMCTVKFKGRTLILIKPTTYMNLSGKAVRYWIQKENVAIENVLVILDDMHIPFGKIRLRGKGSDGGHNGLKSIDQLLGRQDYPRLRMGIGTATQPGQQVNHVLGRWKTEEREALQNFIEGGVKAVKSFVAIGLARAMNEVNK